MRYFSYIEKVSIKNFLFSIPCNEPSVLCTIYILHPDVSNIRWTPYIIRIIHKETHFFPWVPNYIALVFWCVKYALPIHYRTIYTSNISSIAAAFADRKAYGRRAWKSQQTSVGIRRMNEEIIQAEDETTGKDIKLRALKTEWFSSWVRAPITRPTYIDELHFLYFYTRYGR
jgi:hypothetical protein